MMNRKRLQAVLWTAVVVGGTLVSGAASSATQTIPDNAYQEMHWRMIGPFRGGRVRAVAGVPGQPNIFYFGQVDGGVWRSDDFGRTWVPIFDHQDTQSIGAIAVAPSDPSIVYVATGEGLQRPDLSVGDGIYKSTDSGTSWTHLGLRDGQQISALAIDPHDPDRLFAAVLGHPYGANPERGVFRSNDGGKSWTKVLYKDEDTGAYDVDIDPADPQVVYASLWQGRQGPWEYDNAYGGGEGGLYKSTDGGTTWKQLTNGLPDHIVQLNLAIAPSLPSRLYAVLATALDSPYQSDKDLGFYRSDDAGATWYRVTEDARPVMRIGGGDLPMTAVDPKNPDVVYSTSIVALRSRDGGKTWSSMRGSPGGDDYQNIWINPDHTNIMILASDQGAIVSVNGGKTWSSWYNQPTAQLYHVQSDDAFPYSVCSGQQESGSVCISTRGDTGQITFRDWTTVGAIEYGYVAPDPLDPNIIYGAGRNQVSRYHRDTGQVENVTPIPVLGTEFRVDRTQPLIFSPVDPHRLYYAANQIFQTEDGGRTWRTISPDLGREHPGIPPSLGTLADDDPKADKQRGVVYSLGPSFVDLDTLWAGTDDGSIWVTHDGGANWSDVTPPEVTAWSKVTQIVASHYDDQSAYASVSRFRIDDLGPYIYRTHDSGKTWTRITTDLPANAPVDTIREDPLRQGLLFAGTETGVWVSFDDGDHWQSLQLNLPHTSMRDLWIHDNDLIVATHGRSFWILDDLTPLRQLNADMLAKPAFLFEPETAIRVRRDVNTDTPLPLDEPTGENPPAGAILDYYLAASTSDPVTIEILDASGQQVRRFSSTDQPRMSPAAFAKQMIPPDWARTAQTVSTTAGMHRWVWDLRYPPPETDALGYPISAVPHDTPLYPVGPLVVPGRYTVRLTAAGQTVTQPLTVEMDPRVTTPPSDLASQLELERRLADSLTTSSRALNEARSARQQAQQLEGRVHGRLESHVKKFEERLATLVDGAKEPSGERKSEGSLSSVSTDLKDLYGAVGQADVAPTHAQVSAAADLEESLAPLMTDWRELRGSALQALNWSLKRAGFEAIQPEDTPSPIGATFDRE